MAKLERLRVGALFMEMGLGKSRVMIELVRRRQARISRVVWACPASARRAIAAQIRRHTDVPAEDVHVFGERTRPDNLPPASWHVVGLESVSGSARVRLALARLFDAATCLVVDESDLCKSPFAERTRWLAMLAPQARYRFILTGTPFLEGPEDLYAQFKLLDARILGFNSFWAFARNHLEYSEKYPGLVVRVLDSDGLAAKIAPYTYQVTKAEAAGVELPAKRYDLARFAMTPAQRELYAEAKWALLEQVGEEEFSVYDLYRVFSALRQVACGFWNHRGRTLEAPHRRAEALLEALAGRPAGEKTIVWAHYRRSVREVVGALERAYGPGCAAEYHGDVPPARREEALERWRGPARFLVGTPGTGGRALTLNEARLVVFYSNDFKARQRVQAEDRAHRIGQDHPVLYLDLLSDAPIEERILGALRRKEDAARVFKRQVDAMKHSLGVKKALDLLL